MQEQESANAMMQQPYRLLERSIFCDRMVFVESLKDSKIMSEMELSIYNSWYSICLPFPKFTPLLGRCGKYSWHAIRDDGCKAFEASLEHIL